MGATIRTTIAVNAQGYGAAEAVGQAFRLITEATASVPGKVVSVQGIDVKPTRPGSGSGWYSARIRARIVRKVY